MTKQQKILIASIMSIVMAVTGGVFVSHRISQLLAYQNSPAGMQELKNQEIKLNNEKVKECREAIESGIIPPSCGVAINNATPDNKKVVRLVIQKPIQ